MSPSKTTKKNFNPIFHARLICRKKMAACSAIISKMNPFFKSYMYVFFAKRGPYSSKETSVTVTW